MITPNPFTLNPIASALATNPEPFSGITNSVPSYTAEVLNSQTHTVLTKGYSHIKELTSIAESAVKKHITIIFRNAESLDAAKIILEALNTDQQGNSKELQLRLCDGIHFPKTTGTEYIFFDIPNYGKSSKKEAERDLISDLEEHEIPYSFTVFSDKYRNNPYLLELLKGEQVLEKRGENLKTMNESEQHGNIQVIDLENTNGDFRDKHEEQKHAEENMIYALTEDTNPSPTICVTLDIKQGRSIAKKLKKCVVVDPENLEDFLLYPEAFNDHDYIIITKQVIGYLSFEEMASVNLAFFYYASFDKLRKLTKQAIYKKKGATIKVYNYLYEKWGYDQDNQVLSGGPTSKKVASKKTGEKKKAPTIVGTETRLGLTEEADLKRYDDALLEAKVVEEVILEYQNTLSFKDFADKFESIKDNTYLIELFRRKKPGGKKTITLRKYLKYFTDTGVVTLPSKTEISAGIKKEIEALEVYDLPGFLNLRISKKNDETLCYQDLSESPYFIMFLIQYGIQISDFIHAHRIALIEFIFQVNIKENIQKGAINELSTMGINDPVELLLHRFDFEFNGRSHEFFDQGERSFTSEAYKHPYLAHLLRLHSGKASKFGREQIMDLTKALFPGIQDRIVTSLRRKVQVELKDIDNIKTLDNFKEVYWNPSYGYFKLLINLGVMGFDERIPPFTKNSQAGFKLADLELLKSFLENDYNPSDN